jgi:acetolactate synthase I/II/III large subunit
MAKMNGAESLLATLELLGVDTVFGVPGGAILPVYDALVRSPIRHVSARHEQGAGHMAEGYAMATGRPGVVFSTSGPGATNLITPLMNALSDSTPLVAVTGQVATGVIGTNAFQEAPTVELTRACTKANWLVEDVEDLTDTVVEAFTVAMEGRRGPVLIDIPKDVQSAQLDWSPPTFPAAAERSSDLDPGVVARSLDMLERSQRPVLYVGGGIIASGASTALRRFAETTNVPVVTTLMGRGAFPDGHPLALGMPGMHGVYTATTALQQADLLLAVGVRFDDRVTGNPAAFAPRAEVIHVDIDERELGKIRKPELGVVADANAFLSGLVEAHGDRPTPDRRQWLERLGEWRHDKPLSYIQTAEGPIKPQFVIEQLHQLTGGAAVVVSGVGQHQMWASQYWRFSEPRTWLNSGGLGTMGFAVPAAIGAQVARPDAQVWAIDGDGCFQMTMQELLAAAAERIPVKIALLDNGHYGMVKQWQELFYDGRHSAIDVGTPAPDYVGLARSLGCVGLRADTPDQVAPVIEKAVEIEDRPVVAAFTVDPDEHVWPMVMAGGSNDEVLMGPEDLRTGLESGF